MHSRTPGVTLVVLSALFVAACAGTPENPINSAWMPDEAWWTSAVLHGGSLRAKDGAQRSLSAAQAKNLAEVERAMRAQSRMSARLAIVDSATPNAFATGAQGQPVIAVSLGFLAALGDDRDALATTLGHELAHLYFSHGAARSERASAAQGATHVLGALLGMVGVPMGGTIASVGVSAVNTAYSRDEERAADAKGLDWATAAGFSACGSARTIRLLQAKSTSTAIPFLSTHPGYEERIESANALALRLTGKGC